MKISGTLDLRILAQERWIQVAHSLHSIMGLPAKGFRQKQVIRSQASSSGQGEMDMGQKLPRSCGLSPATGRSTTSEATAGPTGRAPPHSPSALVLGAAANSSTGVARGKREKVKIRSARPPYNSLPDTFPDCTVHSVQRKMSKGWVTSWASALHFSRAPHGEKPGPCASTGGPGQGRVGVWHQS